VHRRSDAAGHRRDTRSEPSGTYDRPARRSEDRDRRGGAPYGGGRSSTGAGSGGGDRRFSRSSGGPDHRRSNRIEEDYESTRGSRPTRGTEIAISSGADPKLLDPSVRSELRSLSKLAAEFVGAHLVAAGQLIDTDPKAALEHARAARGRGARVAAVREATGLAAYHAEEWAEALSELRAARRISGDPSNIAVMADCERALGRPERALKALDDPAVPKLDPSTRAELLIVVAGARRDLNQIDAALAVLERGGLDVKNPKPGSARLWYAYADALEAAGRIQDAIQWFGAAAQVDHEDETDAADRAANLL
jgi:tetratricopeptide (TPR) repeat protein